MSTALVIGFTVALIVVALFSATFRPAPTGMQVLAQLGLDGHPELIPLAERTERRARRIRRIGAIAGVLLGAWGAHRHNDSLGNSLAAPWVGYLAGPLVAELTFRLPKRNTIRSASLTPRRMSQLSPQWWRVAGTSMLVLTAVVAPLVRFGKHLTGRDSYTGPLGSCTGIATWPTVAQVTAISLVATTGLAAIELLRWRLSARPAAAESSTALFEERRRERVSRVADRTGLALALALLAALANELASGLHSDWCEAWRRGADVVASEVYTSNLADLGRSTLEPIALILLAASAALMAWAPRQLRRAPAPQPVPVP